jgi:CBS domain-containing protein
MSDPTLEPGAEATEGEETLLDASKLDEQWHRYAELFERLLRDATRTAAPSALACPRACATSAWTTPRAALLPPTSSPTCWPRSTSTASRHCCSCWTRGHRHLIEEMPSDEAADFVGELEDDQAREILAAMEPAEREDVAELLRYEPDTAGGLMAKEFIAVPQDATIMQAVDAVRAVEADDREGLHFVFVVDADGCPAGRIPLVTMLLQPWSTPVDTIMERDPLRVSVDLDQEDVALYVQTHDLVTLPVVDAAGRLVGVIQADDVIDVLEEEATEDYARLAGTSEELGETSPVRVARARLPWLLGALAGEMATMNHEALPGDHHHHRGADLLPADDHGHGGNTGIRPPRWWCAAWPPARSASTASAATSCASWARPC